MLNAELAFSNLPEIAFVDTKLVISVGWDSWAVAGCSLLDAV